MSSSEASRVHYQTVIFGEVLFDTFEDGGRVLGGAPFNVAWHLAGFRCRPLLISRLGNDDNGDEILRSMQSWGLDSRGVQQDDNHPTGTVQVKVVAGQPQFSILPDQAYDFIEYGSIDDIYAALPRPLLYCGTLALRNAESRSTLQGLLDRQPDLFLDVNLRPPWWQREYTGQLLQKARWVKLNDDELETLTECKYPDADALLAGAREFRDYYNIEWLVLTLGDAGAVILSAEREFQDKPAPVSHIADTVGAGDAFTAVTLLGLLQFWEPGLILERALEFASRICEQQGAISSDRDFYTRYTLQWSLHDCR
jgi:fructokinase